MGRYDLLIKPSAVKELEWIDRKKDRQKVVSRIQSLADDPRPPGCEKLAQQDRYRVRPQKARSAVFVIGRERLDAKALKQAFDQAERRGRRR